MGQTWSDYRSSQRLGIDLYSNDADPTSTIWCTIRFEGYQIIDKANTLDWSGEVSGSNGGIYHATSWSGTEDVASFSFARDRLYGEWRDLTIDASLGILERLDPNVDEYLYHSNTISLPPRPYALPRPPRSMAVARNSDTSHTVSWTGDYTGSYEAQPWDNVVVSRWDNVTNSWNTQATKSWDTTSYTNTTVADRRYHYAVWSHNSSGDSTHVHVLDVYTTPATPTAVVAAKDASNDIVVSWSNPSTIPGGTFTVYHAINGGAYSQLATTTSLSYLHDNPTAGDTHTYKVMYTCGGRASAQSTATTGVTTLTTPGTPAINLTSLTTADVDEAKTVTWTPNHPDGTGQTAYRFRYRKLLTTTWTTTADIVSGTSGHSLPAGTLDPATRYEVEVSTKGQHVDFSPWGS